MHHGPRDDGTVSAAPGRQEGEVRNLIKRVWLWIRWDPYTALDAPRQRTVEFQDGGEDTAEGQSDSESYLPH